LLRNLERLVQRSRHAHPLPPEDTPRLIVRTDRQMSRPLHSTPVTWASLLLGAGPPADAATVLNASQFLLLGVLPLATHPSGAAAVSASAFPRSIQKPQTGLAPPPCRTPPGQSAGTRQAHPGAI
jgi:hypothetical protein